MFFNFEIDDGHWLFSLRFVRRGLRLANLSRPYTKAA